MKQTTCPDCGAVYAADKHSCPTCGCPNDNYQAQQEEQQPKAPEQSVNKFEDDFNENGQYSPLASKPWFFKTPWPLKNYPERKMFEEAHPFLGWLFGPWYLTCKSEDEKEEFAVINNIFYFFNLIFKTCAYATLWMFFKGFPFILIYFLMQLLLVLSGRAAVENGNNGSMTTLAFVGVLTLVVAVAVGILLIVLECCGLGQSLHRYWPSIHRTWRRINKRYWKAMQNK